MKRLVKKLITGAVIAAGLMTSAHGGSPHLFTVTCPNNAFVVEWASGDIDPGREFLRHSTGTDFPGCSVGDYQDKDARLQRIRYSYEEAILRAAPVIGSIIGGLLPRR